MRRGRVGAETSSPVPRFGARSSRSLPLPLIPRLDIRNCSKNSVNSSSRAGSRPRERSYLSGTSNVIDFLWIIYRVIHLSPSFFHQSANLCFTRHDWIGALSKRRQTGSLFLLGLEIEQRREDQKWAKSTYLQAQTWSFLPIPRTSAGMALHSRWAMRRAALEFGSPGAEGNTLPKPGVPSSL